MKNIYNFEEYVEIAKELKDGKIIAFPTDTVFGLGCIYDNIEGLKRIKEIKKRDQGKSLPIMCSNLEMIKNVGLVDEKLIRLVDGLGNGAITYILPKHPDLDPRINDYKQTVAIRIPDHDFVLNLIDALGKPMLVTSCNLSNEKEILKAKDALELFKDKVDIFVMEDAMGTFASTIYDVANDKILRQGEIKMETIKEVLKNA